MDHGSRLPWVVTYKVQGSPVRVDTNQTPSHHMESSGAGARGFKLGREVLGLFTWGNHCGVIARLWRRGQMCGRKLPFRVGHRITVILS